MSVGCCRLAGQVFLSDSSLPNQPPSTMPFHHRASRQSQELDSKGVQAVSMETPDPLLLLGVIQPVQNFHVQLPESPKSGLGNSFHHP